MTLLFIFISNSPSGAYNISRTSRIKEFGSSAEVEKLERNSRMNEEEEEGREKKVSVFRALDACQLKVFNVGEEILTLKRRCYPALLCDMFIHSDKPRYLFIFLDFILLGFCRRRRRRLFYREQQASHLLPFN